MDYDLGALAAQLYGLVTEYGITAVEAVAILIAGWIGAGWARRWLRRLLRGRKGFDQTLTGFFASGVRYAILVFTVVAVLAQVGIQTTSFIAVLGAAGLAIGLALQGTLANVAAGVLLLILRPFKAGDYVEAGSIAGTVDEILLFTTIMHTSDNVHQVVPNAQLWNTAIKNYSHNPTRRLDITIGISYDTVIGGAIEVAQSVIDRDPRVLKDPEPLIAVTNLGDSAVDILVRVWANRGDHWALKLDLTQALKENFDHAGIEIPYPQRVVHLHQAGAGE